MNEEFLLVRYGEIGTKSEPVRSRMVKILRQRVSDRLDYEKIDFETVSVKPGRIIVEKIPEPMKAAEAIAELPGVSSASPAYRVEPEIEALKKITEKFEVGETFGIETNRSGDHSFDSRDVNREVGGFVAENTGAEVDLDDPETWINFDVRADKAFTYTEKFSGPDGMPAGSGDKVAALISGGIDSPVAAHEIMKRGSDTVPIYFYNRPIAAEDHFLRFRSVVEKLKRFNPSRDWKAYKIDMQEVNEKLMDLGSGRMVIHRRMMFALAQEIAEKEGMKGLVTGESLSQKSSQTAANLKATTETVDLPVLRPLISHSKKEIVAKAREIGTYEDAKIASACSTMAPDNPRTRMDMQEVRNLEEKVDFDELVEKAVDSVEVIEF